MPAPTMAPMPRNAAPRTLTNLRSRRCRIGVAQRVVSPKKSQAITIPASAVAIQQTWSGSWNEWSTTRLPSVVVPVVSASAAAICVPLAGRNSTPTTAVHIAIM